VASGPDSENESGAPDDSTPGSSEDSVSDLESIADGDRATGLDEPPGESDSIGQRLRSRLLSADVRFPLRSHRSDAVLWLQAYVDVEIGAGLSLVGTGNSNSDAFRELIWADQSGQLFVSDGAVLAGLTSSTTSADSAATTDATILFVESLRLRATERFVALADFDGDGVGDWLIEDAATLEFWVINGETLDTIAVEGGMQLVGQGDFDGDGRGELLWSDADGSFRLSHPMAGPGVTQAFDADPSSAAGSAIDTRADIRADTLAWTGSATFDLETSRLLTVADLNGDGRDDLMFVDSEGRLQSALSAPRAPQAGAILFTSSVGSGRSIDDLELLATLDLDGDGGIEIAWLDGVDLVFWDSLDAP
jgi:hypothetical protein